MFMQPSRTRPPLSPRPQLLIRLLRLRQNLFRLHRIIFMHDLQQLYSMRPSRIFIQL
jgi:hypothetical protein